MAQQTSSFCSPCISRYTYDVFLSFRGEDTRFGFTGNLYSALSQRGIFTFIDDEALQTGQEITPSLHRAIRESRMSIIIFSKNYASSTFCLDELVQILECYTKQNMLILPVFYDIDPSHVRHQKGSYQEALAMHERGRFKDNIEKVQKWRLALRQAAELSGSHIKIGGEYEFEFVKRITEDVSSKLNRRPMHIADYPVGLKARMKQIWRLMGAEFDNKVTMLGIHGMGGIGKSTLARAIYNRVADQFEASYFLANVREMSAKHGLAHIQETMLSELVGERNIKLGDVYRGIPILQQRLCRKKVLLVLDDVNKKEQLQATAGGLNWFGPGSIIIITTRDKHLLDIHGVEKQYEVNKFNDVEALELFRWNAFKNKEVDTSYMEIIRHAIYYARGLPLALEIIGSNLLGKTLDEWESALEAYERIPDRDVQEILRVSYDSLNANEKEIFLDIACFFRGSSLKYVTSMLEAKGFHPKFGMGVLEKKSLIKIVRNFESCDSEGREDELVEWTREIVSMHDLIQSMGREIVREQSTWCHKRSRLWFYEDIHCVLEKNTENDEIEAMMFAMEEDRVVQCNQKVFGKMKNLRMLLLTMKLGFSRSSIDLPNSLRVLEWWGYPESSLPSNFDSKNLVILDLSYSYFQWDKPLQNPKALRYLILRGCKYIRRIPNMSGFLNLTELYVCECTNLIEIHDSVGSLPNLQVFCAKRCTKLKIAPRGIKLTSLEYLNLRDCSSLVIFPEILAPMKKLSHVDLGGTAIKNLPHSMKNLEGLRKLSLDGWKMLECNEPFNIFQMLPEIFHNLKKLSLQDTNFTVLPAFIEECQSLKCLSVNNCQQLQEIKVLPASIIHVWALNTLVEVDSLTSNMLLREIGSTKYLETSYYILPSKRIPEWFDHCVRGNSLCFWFRNQLPSFTLGVVCGSWVYLKPPFHVKFNLLVTINDIDLYVSPYYWRDIKNIPESDHVCVINIQNHFLQPMNSDIESAFKKNQWIRGNVSFAFEAPNEGSLEVFKWTGVYANRAFSRMEDIRFTDPYPPNNTSDVGNKLVLLGEAPDLQQQQKSTNYVSRSSDSQEPACIVDYSNDPPDEAFLDNQAMAPSFAETQNAKAPREMGTLISEVSRKLTHQDYCEASMKIKSTVSASESHKLDDVETGFETKKSQFSKAMALVNELHQKLTRIKKMEKDLREKLGAIKANISAIEDNNSSIKDYISSIKAIISASQSESNINCLLEKEECH